MKNFDIMAFEGMRSYMKPTIQDYVTRTGETPQGTKHHPEGDVLVHTKIVFARARNRSANNVDMQLAALFHDLGKVDTTVPKEDGGYSAHEHELVSTRLLTYARREVEELGGNYEKIKFIVRNHMRAKRLDEMKRSKVAELEEQGEWFDDLMLFTECDDMSTATAWEVWIAGGSVLRFLYNKYYKHRKDKK